MKNDGKLTFTYKIVWTVSKEDGDDKTEGSFEQIITINVDAAKVTLTDARVSAANKDVVAKTLWAPSIAKAYKDSLPATPEESTPTEESGKDSQPKTGEEIPMALVGMMTLGLAGAYTFKKSNVFVVGNVSASTEKKVTYGEVKDITATDTRYYDSEDEVKGEADSNDKNKTVVIDYDAASLKYLGRQQDLGTLDRGKDAAWLGIRIDKLTVNDSAATLKSATLNGSDFYIPTSTSGLVTLPGDYEAGSNQYDIWTPVTVEDLQKAVVGNGVYTVTYVLTWEQGDDENKTTYNQTIIINVKADQVTITDLRTGSESIDKELWSPVMAELYTLKNPTTPAEETTTTEGSGKDSQPKTGEGIPMALVGMMTLGLAGAYTFKKSIVFRRRQRLC